MTRMTTAASIAAALLASALTACSPATETAPPATASSHVTETPTAAVEPTPAEPTVEVGQKVSKKEAKSLPAGMTTYKTTDGKLIVIDREQPLPKPVVKDLGKKVGKAWVPGQGLKTDGNYGQLYADTYAATGKKPVIVGKAYLAPANDMWNHRELWTLRGPRGIPRNADGDWTRETATKAAKKWVKQQSDPNEFVVIVQD